MRFAVLSQDEKYVENVIVADASQQEELEAALSRTLLDAAPLGLIIGDYYNGTNWTRNVEGEQVVLPIATPSADVDEALAILMGEVQ